MKEVFSTINYKDKEYRLYFNLNVMEAIQDEYGTIDKWGELTDGKSGEVNIKALTFGITEMLNEGIEIYNEENNTNEPKLTRKTVARILTAIGLKNATENVNNLVINSAGSDSKNG